MHANPNVHVMLLLDEDGAILHFLSPGVQFTESPSAKIRARKWSGQLLSQAYDWDAPRLNVLSHVT